MTQEIESLIQNLRRRNMAGFFVNNCDELLLLLSALVPQGSTIGCGDSVTLEEAGVFQFLRNGNYQFYDKFAPQLSKEQKRNIYIKNFTADTFVTGTNALTMSGEIFNIDGNGSRAAPMLYGPRQVIIIVGMNKLTADIDSAIKRARQTAAPLDAKRLGKHTPCTSLSCCIDCRHKERICNDFVLITGQFEKDRIKVIVVNEKLGY
jgi:hypothetical protein